MSDRQSAQAGALASETGQAFTAAPWLDLHFEACRPEYEAMLRSVGIEPGWRVLDAGCGSGSYLPLLAERVGPGGALAALDLAPDNITHVEARLASEPVACRVATQVATVTTLPYPDDAFDAAWCANTLQYLTDADMRAALAEFRRVVRPGGLIAVKDFGVSTPLLDFMDPAIAWRWADRALRRPGTTFGRERNLRRWLERAGLREVWQRTWVIEFWSPLSPVERRYLDAAGALFAKVEALGLPEEDLVVWRRLRNPASPEHPLNDPEFHTSESAVLAVGQVPHPAT